MSSFVVDCSVTSAWCFSDETSRYADSILHAFSDKWNALAPYIWLLETLNVLWGAEKKKRISRAETTHFIKLFNALPIEIEPVSVFPNLDSRYLALSREYDISVYDSAYLDLALLHNAPLATQDKKLNAAAVKAGVRIFNPDVEQVS